MRQDNHLPEHTTPPSGRYCKYLALHRDGRIGAYGFGDPLRQPFVDPQSDIVAVASYDMLGRLHREWQIKTDKGHEA